MDCTKDLDRCVNTTVTATKTVAFICHSQTAMTAIGVENGKCKDVAGTNTCACDKDNCNSASTQSIIQMFTMIITAYLAKVVFAQLESNKKIRV